MAVSNLPQETNNDSAEKVKTFFNNYFDAPISFPAEQVDAVVGFFEKRGFDKLASASTAVILLTQAKLDNVNVFQLVDTLKGLTDVQLSAVVAEVLNYNRQKISSIGYRVAESTDLIESRNIIV